MSDEAKVEVPELDIVGGVVVNGATGAAVDAMAILGDIPSDANGIGAESDPLALIERWMVFQRPVSGRDAA